MELTQILEESAKIAIHFAKHVQSAAPIAHLAPVASISLVIRAIQVVQMGLLFVEGLALVSFLPFSSLFTLWRLQSSLELKLKVVM